MRDHRLLTAVLLLSLLMAPGLPMERRAAAADQPQAGPAQDWPTIIAKLQEQLSRFPNHPQLRQQLAIVYNNYAVELADQGKLNDAIRQLEEATRLDTANAQLRRNLAMMHLQTAQDAYRTHQIPRAREAIVESLRVEPDTAGAYALLGEIEYNSQRLKEAKAAWQKALTLKPDFAEVNERLKQVSQELPVESEFERVSQAYFDIRFPDTLERSTGFDLQETLLAARRAIGADFAYWPSRKLIVLVYSAEQFRQLRQDAPEWAAGQFDGKIRVPLPNGELNPQAVTHILYHEYTHALIHDLTDGRCPAWLNEGLAEYESWKPSTPAWPMLRHAASAQRLIPWTQLFSAQFTGSMSPQEAALAYEQAHSLVRYLVERYGFWRIKRLLQAVKQGTPSDQAVASEFHLKLPRLEEYWKTWLRDTLF
ncbi:MAG: hypothetical protein HY596_00410 [Candidatus Omnitrophica bacterium]|nr:hypothetical protein [Candidatus Omnitrophota bacterium]